MSLDAIHYPTLMPDMLISGLNRYDDEPCLFLGDSIASYADVRRSTSQLIQALRAKGLGKGSRIAVISSNRPEAMAGR